MNVDGSVAIVTGAGGGLGEVIAVRLAALGARIVVVDLDTGAAHRVATSNVAKGGCAEPVGADVCNAAGVDVILERAESLGPVQILVNNAGGWGDADRRFPDAGPDEWGAVLDLNLRAPMVLTQRCLGPMRRQGQARWSTLPPAPDGLTSRTRHLSTGRLRPG